MHTQHVPVADPEILKKEQHGWNTTYQPCPQLSHMYLMNYTHRIFAICHGVLLWLLNSEHMNCRYNNIIFAMKIRNINTKVKRRLAEKTE